jgi:hypothetical protein
MAMTLCTNLKTVSNGAVNFLYPECPFFCRRRRNENAPQYWELRDDTCTVHCILLDETSANALRFLYPYGAMTFIAAISIGFQIAN